MAEAPAMASTAPTAPAANTAPAPQPSQGLLATKTERRTEAPTVTEHTIIGANSFVERFSDGTIYVTTDGKKEPIDEVLYKVLMQNNSTKSVASSAFTGGASAMEEDTEPIEWGDMDPAFRSLLESTPAMLEAYKTLRNPKKMAKLDTATSSFQPSTNVEVPEPSLTVSIPDTVSVGPTQTPKPHTEPDTERCAPTQIPRRA